MKNNYKILFSGVILAIFGFIFIEVNIAQAACTANITFGPPASVPYNQPLTLSSIVALSGFDNGGANDGYCSGRILGSDFTYKTIYVYYDFGSSIGGGGAPPTSILGNKYKVVTLNFNKNSPPVPATTTITPSEHGFQAGETLNIKAQVVACNSSLLPGCAILTSSGSKNIQLTAGTFTIYACLATNGRYACSAQGANRSDCSGVPNKNTVCGANAPCVQINSALCGQPPQETHKGCLNNSCSVLPGAGADDCRTNADCGGGSGGSGGGGGTTTQDFEIPNPLGINTFEELIGIIGRWIFNLAIPIAVIIIIYAGMTMLTAGGNPARFQKGSKALWYAVLGLAVVLIGKGFVTLVQSILSLRAG